MGTEASRTDLPGPEALGQPVNDPGDTDTGSPDIAGEHEDTAVDKNITAGTEKRREEESPEGWAGMDG